MTRVGRGAWGVWPGVFAVAGFVGLIAAFAWPIATGVPGPVARAVSTAPTRAPAYPGDSLVAVVVSRNLFRFDRRPARVTYDPSREAPPPGIAAPPKPVLVLVGIVAGARATAVMEGFPGVQGARVVRVGDEIGGLRVQRITDNGVRIAGMDTVWALTVREPWVK